MAGDAGFEPTLPGSKPGVATITPIPNILLILYHNFFKKSNKIYQVESPVSSFNSDEP